MTRPIDPPPAGVFLSGGGGHAENPFAAVAVAMVRNGWSIFPQETSGERRLPGKLHGRTIRWSEDHDLSNRPPTPEFIRDCVAQCPAHNVANVFGPASGNTFAVDIDVMDPAMCAAIVEIADDILGPTPFRRIGRAPKIALIYRHGPGEQDRVHNTSRHFAHVDENGTAHRSGDGLEILGATKLITFHGRHHKTGQFFRWVGDANPITDGPSAATLVTPEQVEIFLEAVDARFRFHRGSAFSSSAEFWQWDEATNMNVPRIAKAAGGVPWVEDGDGLISDGREAYLTTLVFQTASGNRRRLDEAMLQGGAALQSMKAEMAKAVEERFVASARTDARGRWSGRELPREIRGKVNHLIEKYRRGDVDLRRGGGTLAPQPDLDMPRVEPSDQDPELSFLKSNAERRRNKDASGLKGVLEAAAADTPDLAIPMDRAPIARMVQEGLDAAFAAFFTDVYGAAVGRGDAQRTRVHLLKAPTGAGKTSRGIRTIAADPRTKEDHVWKDLETGEERTGRAPFVMLLPTYANIDELRARARVLNLDGTMNDEDLRRAATAEGLIAEDELDSKLADLRRDALKCGLETMVYSGKLKAGCKMKEKVELAMSAGLGTSAFCKATVRKDDTSGKPGDGKGSKGKPGAGRTPARAEPPETEEVLCQHYAGCEAIRQRDQISRVHIVFMPHSFLALSIPDELAEVRAVIADERIHHLFLHTATFSATSLSIPRKPPRLTAREKAQEIRAEDLLADRDHAAFLAQEALRRDECPAGALSGYRPESGPDGLALVQSALKVCGSAIQRDGTLTPLTPLSDVQALCSRPNGRDLREEWQFWTIVEERILALRMDAMHREAIADAERKMERFQGRWSPDERLRRERALEKMRSVPTRAKGARDFRIQHLTDHSTNGGTREIVRISWRTEPNWRGVPMLLLDASAAPPIVAKIWRMSERDIVVHDVVADIGRALNVKIVGVVDKTYSNSSIVASAQATAAERLKAARNLATVRSAISAVSAIFGHGRVVAGTSIVLREVINRDWACPDNVDWCHYGAMRGLDGFKFHAAAISVGRMEPPTRTIDGLAAALTYDDDFPEEPFDRTGDGMNPVDGTSLRLPLGDQRLRLRSGHVAVLKVPMFEGKWARLVQRQYREEELLQFVGRLRPVYREGRPPVWVALSSVIPEELVVDDLITMADLLHGKQALWDAARMLGGVLEPHAVAATYPGAAFPDPRRAADAMAAMGFGMDAGRPAKRSAEGFASWRWHAKNGSTGMGFVRGEAPNPEERLGAALSAAGLEMIRAERLWSPEPGIAAMARPRAPDAVEQRIGPADGRGKREADCMDKVGVILISAEGGESDGVNETHRVFTYTDGSTVDPSDVGALVAIEGYWNAKAGVADDRLMPTLTEKEIDPAAEGCDDASYDQLGAHVRDDDTPMAA
jgi:hypothetical protein